MFDKVIKCTQFINNYQKSTLGGTRKKQFVLQSCFFFYVLPRHINVMIDKVFNLFDECASRCVHLSPGDNTDQNGGRYPILGA